MVKLETASTRKDILKILVRKRKRVQDINGREIPQKTKPHRHLRTPDRHNLGPNRARKMNVTGRSS